MYNFNIPTFGPGVVYDVDIKVRNEQFRWLGEALKGKKLLSYVPGFVKEAKVPRQWSIVLCIHCIHARYRISCVAGPPLA